ncbi:DUF4150 domain-containing protein [Tateyamaria pelophila]|uniref:DUF4150 domain-containing protein n=1 Tax=Tateyamaria pelophila TaxID=328415 RepID=UPI001CBD1F4C|nr:DUF4150 domain-containing protein [Tateyamaria pelophila]
MPTHILVNGLGLTYKGTVGISTATIPDVCKTPSPGGPVPIPYPNIAQQSSLKGGTTTVKAKGEMIAVKGSQYGSSNGDEAGTAGGVKSSVNMKATDWITFSFDVKMDGKNACRHTDKKFHNNKNTVCLMGQVDPQIAVRTSLQEIHCNCCRNTQPSRPAELCTEYGNRVDDCCQQAIAALPSPQTLGGERGYNDSNKKPLTNSSGNQLSRAQAEAQGVSFAGCSFPDACSLDSNGNVTQFFDFKTTCPKGQPYTDNRGNIKGYASGNKLISYANAFESFKTPYRSKPSQKAYPLCSGKTTC